MNPDNESNPAAFALELAKHNGVSVATVDDGWFFSFTVGQLQALLDKAKENSNGMAIVFVQSTKETPAGSQN